MDFDHQEDLDVEIVHNGQIHSPHAQADEAQELSLRPKFLRNTLAKLN